MKKFISLLMACLCALSFTACSGKKQPVSVDVSALAQKLAAEVKFEDELTKIEIDMVEKLYGIEQADIVSAAVYEGTGSTAEEAAVFEAKDGDSAKRIQTAVNQRVEDQKESYVDYIPEEMPKLENPVIVVKDNYVVLCISSDNETAKKIINDVMSGK